MARSSSANRWAPHPVSAMLLRLLSLAVPVAASVAVAVGVASLLPGADTVGSFVLQAGLVVVPATATLWVVERLARRFLPLAALLRLSLVFPDRAPSRYAVARLTNSTHELQRRIDDAREKGISDDPSEAARVILALVAALSLHDRRTRGHSERVRLYTDLLAEELRLSTEERDRLRWAALVHDVGKLQVPPRVLNKASPPSEREWDLLRSHPKEGERLCAPLLPWLGEPGRAIVEHHERHDGKGYPEGLRGEEISLYGRILSVADAFEVMTAARAYKRAMNASEARAELSRCAGTQFDPAVVRAFLGISLRRVRLAMGPLSWLAQWPVIAHLPSAGKTAGQVSGTVAGVAALSTSAWLHPPPADGSPAPAAIDSHEALEPREQRPHSEDLGRVDPIPREELVPVEEHVLASTARQGIGAEDRGEANSGDTASPSTPSEATEPQHTSRPRDPAEEESTPPGGTSGPASDVTDTIDEVADELTDTVDDLTDDVTDTVREVGDSLPEPLGEATDDVADVLDATSDDLTDAADDGANEATDTLDDADAEPIDDVTGGLLDRR